MNRIHRPLGIILAGLLACHVAACASDDAQQQATFERKVPRTVEALNAQGGADSLAAAAEFTSKSDAQRLTLFARAAALAPDRADLVWLQLEECGRVEACDPAALAATLHELDPDNGAAWAPSLDRAIRDGDADATNKSLSAIASSKRLDIYWNPSIARLSRAVANVHTMDLSTALTAVIGSEAALAIPAYQNLSKSCKAPVLEQPGRIDICRKIADVMRGGDTYITEMIGVAIAKRVWPEDSPEYADAVAARRIGQYRMRTEGEILPASFRTDAEAQKYVTLLATHRAEQEVALAVITAAGKSPEPPADWKEPGS
jgi:hypothetical protein